MPQRGEHNHSAKNQPAILQREIDERAKHLLVPRGFKQQGIANHLLARINSRQNRLPVAG